MSTTEISAELAKGWIEAWIRMDMEWLHRHLSPDFVHVSPFGRLEGRDKYLETVEPMARKSVNELIINDVVASGNQAAIRFVNRTPGGDVDSCDWIQIQDGKILEIHSFYDSFRLRKVLSSDEQNSLDGS
jgi:ketosteroid isomerase-like protein